MEKIHVIGIGLNKKDLTERHLDMIRNATLLAGGSRQLDLFPGFQGKRLTVTADIDGFIQTLKQEMTQERIVVLASGDPLYYGIGSTLLKHIPASLLAVHPNITSIASAFSAICTPGMMQKL